MEKYYYHQGRCEANSYLGLNPVAYELVGERIYRRDRMACSYIKQGKCEKEYTCPLLIEAPETVEDNGANLRKDKM